MTGAAFPGAFPGGWIPAVAVVAVAVAAAVRGVWSPCGLSMISAINPFSEHSRGHRYWLTTAWFILGSVAGGLAFGAVGAVGAEALALLPATAVSGPMVAALAAAGCVVTLLSDSPGTRFRLPNHPRQVNERWLADYRRWVYAAGFGAQIGAGFATYVMTAAVYLTPVLGALSRSPGFALLLGVLFGAVRGAAVLLSSGAKDPSDLRRLHRRLERFEPLSLRLAMLVVAAVGLLFGAVAAGVIGAAAVAVILIGVLGIPGAVVSRIAGRVARRQSPGIERRPTETEPEAHAPPDHRNQLLPGARELERVGAGAGGAGAGQVRRRGTGRRRNSGAAPAAGAGR